MCLVQIAAGSLLVARRYLGLALVALAPIVVEITAFRLWTSGARPLMVLVALALVAAQIWVAAANRRMFTALASPR